MPVFLRTLFKDTPVGRAKSVLTIHNLRFQGIFNIPTIKYWTGLPSSVFNMGALQQDWVNGNLLKAASPTPTASPPSAGPTPAKSRPSSTASASRTICASTAGSCAA